MNTIFLTNVWYFLYESTEVLTEITFVDANSTAVINPNGEVKVEVGGTYDDCMNRIVALNLNYNF